MITRLPRRRRHARHDRHPDERPSHQPASPTRPTHGGRQRYQTILRDHEPPTEPLQPSDLRTLARRNTTAKGTRATLCPPAISAGNVENAWDYPNQLEADQSRCNGGKRPRPGAQGGRRHAGCRHVHRWTSRIEAPATARRAEPHTLPRAEDRSDEGGSPDTSCHGRFPHQRQQQQHRAFERHVDRGREAADDRAGSEREGEDRLRP